MEAKAEAGAGAGARRGVHDICTPKPYCRSREEERAGHAPSAAATHIRLLHMYITRLTHTHKEQENGTLQNTSAGRTDKTSPTPPPPPSHHLTLAGLRSRPRRAQSSQVKSCQVESSSVSPVRGQAGRQAGRLRRREGGAAAEQKQKRPLVRANTPSRTRLPTTT